MTEVVRRFLYPKRDCENLCESKRHKAGVIKLCVARGKMHYTASGIYMHVISDSAKAEGSSIVDEPGEG